MSLKSRLPGKFAIECGQRGAVLIFCLVFLLVLTMMNTASMESSILEEKMTGNMLDYARAFHAAEAALHAGESMLSGETFRPDASSDGSTGVWEKNVMDPDLFNSIPWWSESARHNSDWWSESGSLLGSFPELAVIPAFIIEEIMSVSSPAIEAGAENVEHDFYRVTARGTGGQDSTIVQLQSVFATSSIAGAAPEGRQSWRQLD